MARAQTYPTEVLAGHGGSELFGLACRRIIDGGSQLAFRELVLGILNILGQVRTLPTEKSETIKRNRHQLSKNGRT